MHVLKKKSIWEEKPYTMLATTSNQKYKRICVQKDNKNKRLGRINKLYKCEFFDHFVVRTKRQRTKEIKKKNIINFRQSKH